MEEAMNAKQSLKAASKHIEELEDWNLRASAEIKHLNQCIDSVIAGEKTYCDWCEDQQECQRECKGAGCSEWWLMLNIPETEEGENDDSERVLSASPVCGTGTEDHQGETGTL
jgi:hypothetical protein